MNARVITASPMDFVPIDKINVDHDYQRPLDELRVKRMAEAFSSGAVKTVSLSRRDDGSLWCYDGQHTLAVLRLLRCTHVHATVVPGDKKKEAHWFALMNGSGPRKATVRDVQRAEVVSEQSLACLVEQLLKGYQIAVGKNCATPSTTSAIGSIRGWAKADPVRLGNVMYAIHSMWGSEPYAWSQIVMRGMWDCASDPRFNVIVIGLQKKKVTPRRVLDSASAMQLATGVAGGGSGYAKRAIVKLACIKESEAA